MPAQLQMQDIEDNAYVPMVPEQPMISIENVRKQYSGSVVALDGVNLAVKPGEWVAIMGPSGSGKSTLLNIVGCLDLPTSGRVVIAGTDTSSLTGRELTRFRAETAGFIFQQFHLIPYLTALENVMMAQYFHSMTDEQEARKALDLVGLKDRSHHLPSQLSGGEQQRVSIARALINQPRILLADEPTGNLDAENERIVMSLLRELHMQGNTILMVTHDPIIGEMADRKIVLEHGRIIHAQHYTFEEEILFDEVLEQLWVFEERAEHATQDQLQFEGGGNLKLLPVMQDIGLLHRNGKQLAMTLVGRERAASHVRRHRLAECLFAETIHVKNDRGLKSNACTFDQLLSSEMTEKICTFLNHPSQCPHGNLIPPGPCCSYANT